MSADISNAQFAWDLDDPDYQAPLVTIFGAGIAGLTVAHELVERGFHVQVVEAKESQFEEYECEVGGMAANQFSRVPAPLTEVHPTLSEVELDRFRQVRRFYQHAYEFERAQPRFPIKHRLRFDKRAHGVPPAGGLREESKPFRAAPADVSPADHDRVPQDWREYWDEHDVKNLSKLQAVLHIIKAAHTFYFARYVEREQGALTANPGLPPVPDPTNRLREILLIQIIGYTDSDGLPEDNRATGEYWAGQVKEALVALNDKQRLEFQVRDLGQHLEIVGAGASLLRGDPRDPLARARSNRVEFQIVEQLLPGEHGFRFFPNFYRHLFDTMRRTPILGSAGRGTRVTAFNQLVRTPDAYLALEDDRPPFLARLRRFRTLVQIRDALDCFVERLGFTVSDLALFNLKFQRYMTSSRQRRQKEAEDTDFIKYFQGPRPYSKAAIRFINATPRALAAMSATETDARTQCNILLQLLGRDPLQAFVDDMTLNGPTSEAWLLHWKRYLVQQGVRFFVGRLRHLRLEDGALIPEVDGPDGVMVPRAEDPRHQLRGLMVDRNGRRIAEDPAAAGEGSRRQFYVLALPFEQAAAVADGACRAASRAGIALQGPLRQLVGYAEFTGRPAGGNGQPRRRDPITGRPQGRDSVRDISGIQYFFPNNYRLGAGHVYWVDSPWALTSISQLAFWQDRVRPVGDYIGQLSVDLGDWYAPDTGPADAEGRRETGNTAWHSTRWEIAQSCWEQIKAGLSPERREVINPPRYFHLDLGIVFSDEKFVGSHGNLILGVSPAALRRPKAEDLESYQFLLIRSTPSEEPEVRDDDDNGATEIHEIEFESTTKNLDKTELPDVAKYINQLAHDITAKINERANGFAFAVHEASLQTSPEVSQWIPADTAPQPDPSEILVSPVISKEEIVIYFRGESRNFYYVYLNGRVLFVPPAASAQDAIMSYYLSMLQKELDEKKEAYIDVAFAERNYVVIRSRDPDQPITCAVVNRDDMIEVVDGPRLEVKSRFPNLQVLGRPERTSGVGRAAAFRANALIESEAAGADGVVYPEPGRLYRLSVSVETEEGRTTVRCEHPAAPRESAVSLFDELCNQLQDRAPAGLIHVEQVEVGLGREARPAILISPCTRAAEILIRITGSSARPFNVEVDGRRFALRDDGSTPPELIRNQILERLPGELAASPAHADIVVAAVGQQSLRLSRKTPEAAAPADGRIAASRLEHRRQDRAGRRAGRRAAEQGSAHRHGHARPGGAAQRHAVPDQSTRPLAAAAGTCRRRAGAPAAGGVCPGPGRSPGGPRVRIRPSRLPGARQLDRGRHLHDHLHPPDDDGSRERVGPARGQRDLEPAPRRRRPGAGPKRASTAAPAPVRRLLPDLGRRGPGVRGSRLPQGARRQAVRQRPAARARHPPDARGLRRPRRLRPHRAVAPRCPGRRSQLPVGAGLPDRTAPAGEIGAASTRADR